MPGGAPGRYHTTRTAHSEALIVRGTGYTDNDSSGTPGWEGYGYMFGGATDLGRGRARFLSDVWRFETTGGRDGGLASRGRARH